MYKLFSCVLQSIAVQGKDGIKYSRTSKVNVCRLSIFNPFMKQASSVAFRTMPLYFSNKLFTCGIQIIRSSLITNCFSSIDSKDTHV